MPFPGKILIFTLKNMILFKHYLSKTSAYFTLAKLCGAIFTVTTLAIFKYIISGSVHIEYCDFWNNVAFGLLGWTVNTGIMGWLTEYLGIKGINFNLYELFFGLDTMKQGGNYTNVESKPKLYNAMDLDEDSDTGEKLDKGKGIDREAHPNYDRGWGAGTGASSSDNQPSDQGKEVSSTSPPPIVWNKFVHIPDPYSYLPKRINPGPGFNVPGGEVPIRDEICKHIDWNSHILNQFKTMDLEVAIEQRNTYYKFIAILDHKIAYAQSFYEKIPAIPRNEHEFNFRNKVISDLEGLNRDKVRSEAKATLLTSRIQFIEIQMNNSNNNNNGN